jgi:large subunit ribosomal protein L21
LREGLVRDNILIMARKYAIIEINGRQEMVSEGDTVNILGALEGDTYKFPKVLGYYDGELKLGKPLLSGVEVSGMVIAPAKTKKIRVAKFKAKSKYHKVVGHRQDCVNVKISSIKQA